MLVENHLRTRQAAGGEKPREAGGVFTFGRIVGVVGIAGCTRLEIAAARERIRTDALLLQLGMAAFLTILLPLISIPSDRALRGVASRVGSRTRSADR